MEPCYMPMKVSVKISYSVLMLYVIGEPFSLLGLVGLTPLLSSPCVHRCAQGSAGLHDPFHHLLCHLPRGLRVPALHHGEGKPLLPLGSHHAGVLWVSQARIPVYAGNAFMYILPWVLLATRTDKAHGSGKWPRTILSSGYLVSFFEDSW